MTATTPLRLSLGLFACCFLAEQSEAYDYKRHIPEEFRHFAPDDGADDKSEDHKDVAEKYGPAEYRKRTFSTLTVSGPTTLHYVDIKNTLKVHGPLDAHHTTMGRLEVMGPVNCSHTIVEAGSTVFGPLYAEHSNFRGHLRIATNELTLKHSDVSAIRLIHNDANHKRTQKVHLHRGTVVHGDITFEDGDGIVITHTGAKIIGNVIGGVIKHLN
ncbi:MAG: hypothetical protein K2X98_00710 [Alphaproteobacteria bacterium]|nr:hypothetical protein [Alphaproteobacteria bacterium]MBX9976758.1 hypothetical protein [Alphaproteobacteria bacterium]